LMEIILNYFNIGKKKLRFEQNYMPWYII